ncbi:MAG: nucleotide exchange factor GrpE [Muribaculaceae bacterium]|nr:nucleotide exchange factor GrpE [Muribaculaceae bacterium]
MSKKNKKNQSETLKNAQEDIQEQETLNVEDQASSKQQDEQEDPAQKIAKLEEELAHEKKEYLFLMADFENFRKRTLKEKSDLIKNGAESAMRDLLPVVDDLERALDAIDKGGDLDSLKQGVDLIYNKFVKYLESQHVTAIESTGKDFDTDVHEAVTMFPAPDPSMKGKVIDTTIKGYMINDKVLRHAKVVVGS